MKNTMEKDEYLFTQLCYSTLSVVCFRTMCFIPIIRADEGISRLIYWVLVLLVTSLGYVLTNEKRRNSLSAFVNATLPNGVYMLVGYNGYFTVFHRIVLGVGAALIAVFAVLALVTKAKTKTDRFSLFQVRAAWVLHRAGVVAALCVTVLIVSIGINTLRGVPLHKPTRELPVASAETEQWTVKNQIETVRKLKPEIWSGLTREEKQDVLEVVKNIERRYWGIGYPIELEFSDLEGDTRGVYHVGRKQIVVDLEHLDNASAPEVLHTILHEMQHVYQYNQVELLDYIPTEYLSLDMFSLVLKYAGEFDEYIDGNEDYGAYSEQYVEIVANRCAEEGVVEYYEQIKEYTGE